MAQFHQDWSQNVVENKSNTYNKKSGGGSNAQAAGKKKKKKKPKGNDMQKAEAEETNFAVKHVGVKFSIALQRARVAKGWKQEDLAQRLNVHKTIINQYESGKAIPNSQIIAHMNRLLGTKLPRPGAKSNPQGGAGGGKKKSKSKSKNKNKSNNNKKF